MRSLAPIAFALILALTAGAAVAGRDRDAAVPDPFATSLEARATALDKTDALLGDMLKARRAQLADRVRALYKASRHGSLRLWVDPAERTAAIRRQGAAVMILRREMAELSLIEGEAVSAASARGRLAIDGSSAISLPAARSLRSPISGGRVVGRFGDYRDEATGIRLARRGIDLSARAGKNVRAVDAGEVRFVGELRGLGQVIVISHGSYMSVLGRLGRIEVSAGQSVARGDVIAEAIGDRVYLEIRALAGRGGFPIDPVPLID